MLCPTFAARVAAAHLLQVSACRGPAGNVRRGVVGRRRARPRASFTAPDKCDPGKLDAMPRYWPAGPDADADHSLSCCFGCAEPAELQ